MREVRVLLEAGTFPSRGALGPGAPDVVGYCNQRLRSPEGQRGWTQ